MKWSRVVEPHLSVLKADIDGLVDRYQEDESWLSEYFGQQRWHRKMFDGGDIELVLDPSPSNDLENSIRLFNGLKGISRTLAVDEGFWTYLSHVTFWEYMRSRWPVSDGLTRIRSRYFFDSGGRHRALVRHGIARLWWYAYATYDETRENPFELTEVLLKRISVAQALLERSMSSNPKIMKGILIAIDRAESLGGFSAPVRTVVRDDLMGYMNQIGGVRILDVLSVQEIERMAFERMRPYIKRTA